MKLKVNTKGYHCADCNVLLLNNKQKKFHSNQYPKGHREYKTLIKIKERTND